MSINFHCRRYQFITTFSAARKTLLKYLLKIKSIRLGIRNMQCMLKAFAQCLQWQIDPETGQRTKAVLPVLARSTAGDY